MGSNFRVIVAVCVVLLLAIVSQNASSQARQGRGGNSLAGIDWNKPFPAHKVIGNMYFVGSEQLGSFLITTPQGHILINTNYEELRRETLLGDLRRRIRDVKQGRDGLLYLATDEADAVILRIEPAE